MPILEPRQTTSQCTDGDCFPGLNGNAGSGSSSGIYPDSTSDVIIRYVVVVAVVALIVLWVFLGMWHAQRRQKKGLPPLFYHRWLVPSRPRYNGQSAAWPNNRAYQGGPQEANGVYRVPMENWQYAPPPPVYTNDVPPNYMPPPTKYAKETEVNGATTRVEPVNGESARDAQGSASEPPQR